MEKDYSEFNTFLSLDATEIKCKLKVATCWTTVIGWNAETLSEKKVSSTYHSSRFCAPDITPDELQIY